MICMVGKQTFHFVSRESVVSKPMVLTCALMSMAMASCVSGANSDRALRRAAEDPSSILFLRDHGTPLPAIGRAIEGPLSLNLDGCVYLSGSEPLLIIWPPDAAFDRRTQSFRTARSGELRLGMKLTFTGSPVIGPLKVGKIGGVEVPASCRRMSILFVGPDGARKL